MGDTDGEEALRLLMTQFDVASCKSLSEAIRNLLETRLDYRTHLHPRVRSALDTFNLEGIDPITKEPMTRLVVSASPEGLKQLELRLAELTEQAAYETMLALQRESVMPALVLHAAVEQFEDELIRSGHSKREFARLARTHQARLWPQEFARLEAALSRAGRVDQLIELVSAEPAGRRTS